MPRVYLKGKESPAWRPAIERFAERCRFEPTTGCVIWTGGTSAGKGNSARYGRFWDDGFNWYAHRWAAIHIHGLVLGDKQGGHCCPHGVNSLCVEHITGQTQLENLEELNARLKARAAQSNSEKQFWLFVQLGIEPAPQMPVIDPELIPFYEPPAWLKPYLRAKDISNDCPF